jgi:hydroxymethylglutaryl-CoA synthase
MAYKAYRMLYEREAARRNGKRMGVPLDFSFELHTSRALWANREMGNLYSGSLYLSLAGILERGDAKVEGALAGLFSYGSGCCGEFFGVRMGNDASAWRGKIGISKGLERRAELDYGEYLSFRKQTASLSREGSNCMAVPCTGHTGRIAFRGIRDHKRVYENTGAAPERARIEDAPIGAEDRRGTAPAAAC